MSARFAPKGDRPEWKIIYDELLANADFGTVISYRQLEELLSRPFEPNRAPLYRARKELAEQRKRWLEAVPNVGYRVTSPEDHVRVSAGYKKRSRHQMGLAVKVLEATDLSRLDADSLRKWDAEQKMTFAMWAIVAHESRLRRIEDVLRKEGLL